jgi:hypothetical protein
MLSSHERELGLRTLAQGRATTRLGASTQLGLGSWLDANAEPDFVPDLGF